MLSLVLGVLDASSLLKGNGGAVDLMEEGGRREHGGVEEGKTVVSMY